MLKYAHELYRAYRDPKYNQEAIDELKQTIQDFVNLTLESVRTVSKKCKDVRDDFEKYKSTCVEDQKGLMEIRKRVLNQIWDGEDPIERDEKSDDLL
jgi:hypothetical protein